MTAAETWQTLPPSHNHGRRFQNPSRLGGRAMNARDNQVGRGFYNDAAWLKA